MFNGLFIVSILGSCYQAIKEAFEPTIPAENWGNKELYHKDLMDGVPIGQRMKNLENGKYKLEKKYPEPHRNANGQIAIENCLLYKEDLKNYGAYQTMKWARQGKYNLAPDELEKENQRIKAELKRLYGL